MPETRAQTNRRIRQEETRKKFQASAYINQLEEAGKEFTRIVKELKKAATHKSKLTRKEKDDLMMVRLQIDVLKAQMDAIKAKVDLNLRRLKFCVPELKAVELSAPGGGPLLPPELIVNFTK